MAISKIILNGITQIDLTQDTVSQAGHIMAPYIGHLNNGTQVTGTGTGSTSVTEVENEYGTEVIIITGQTPTPEPDPTPTPSGDWETVFDSTITSTLHTESGKYVARIEELQDLWFTLGDTWRVTYDGVQYICVVGTTGNNGTLLLGNSSLIDTDNGINEPFLMYNIGGGEMICLTRTTGEHTLKLEQSV